MEEDSQSNDSDYDHSSSVVYDDEEEPKADYRQGGYHPVQPNEIFLNRYHIVQKVGWGHFSTVWLCKDTKYNTFVAMKVQKSASNYAEAAYDEIDILMKISSNCSLEIWKQSITKYLPGEEMQELEHTKRGQCFVVQLLNSFTHTGPNGRHVCMVFEILGVNLLEIIKRYSYKGIPIPLVRIISKQILIGLDYLHRICGIIHTDLKPENVLLQLTKAQINEIIKHGMLKTKIDCEPIRVVMPEIVRYKEPSSIPTDPAELKKFKKAEKKKRLRLKKKELQQKILAENPEVQPAPLKKKKKRNKNKKNNKNKNKNNGIEGSHKPSESKEIAESESKEVEESVSSNQQDHPRNPADAEEPNPINENIRVKIADLGNGCWLDTHFSTEIQTRQYRSPEVIMGISYNHTADLWSFACMIFELITGDFLFEPKSGDDCDKDEDHLAQMIETLGFFPHPFALSGLNSKKFFTRQGEFRRAKHLRIWPLLNVLLKKYRLKHSEATGLADFLLPMLVFEPQKRATAEQMLGHYWLDMPKNYNVMMTEAEYFVMTMDQKDVEAANNERIKRGESPVLYGIRMPSSEDNSDVEDNSEESQDSQFSEIVEEKEFVENLDYHEHMKSVRHSLMANNNEIF